MTSSASSAPASMPRAILSDRGLQLRLAALGVLAVAAFWDLVQYESYRKIAERMEGADEFFFSPTGASPGFVLGIAIYLLYHRSRIFLAALGTGGRLAFAVPLLAVSVVCLGWGRYTGGHHLLPIAATLFLLGVAEAAGGRRAVRAFLPSALLILMLVPAPPTFFNAMMYELQIAIAAVTTQLVSWMGLDVFQAGAQIVTDRGVFQVIESCTGLRITETLLATTPLYAALFHRSDARMLLLVVLTPVIGMLANELRVVSLVLTPFSYFHEVHLAQGLVFLVIGVLGIAGLDSAFERLGWQGRRAPAPPRRERSRERAARRLVLCAAVAAGMVVVRIAVPEWQPAAHAGPSVQRLRSALKEIPSSGEKIDALYLGSVRFGERLYRRYSFDGSEIGLFVATDDRADLGRSPLSEKTEHARPGFRVERAWERPAPAGEWERALVLYSPISRERVLVVSRYGGVSSGWREAFRYLLALDRSPWRRSDPAWVVRFDIPLTGGAPATVDTALARLDAFAVRAAPALAAVGLPYEPVERAEP